jgi:hypothetical protein
MRCGLLGQNDKGLSKPIRIATRQQSQHAVLILGEKNDRSEDQQRSEERRQTKIPCSDKVVHFLCP